MPSIRKTQGPVEDIVMLDDDPFSDFDIENDGASSTPAVTKSKGKPTPPKPATTKPTGAAKVTKAKSTSAPKGTGASMKKTKVAKGKGKGKAPAHEYEASMDISTASATNTTSATVVPATAPEVVEVYDDDEEEGPRASIPPQLLTRIVHGFFERDGTRMTKTANDAVARYVEVFAREAVARAAVNKRSGFLEVQDLEKIGPQLLLDM